MILPGSFIFSLLLLIVSLLAWGSWPNTFKAVSRKWRFELYYCDFAVGFLIAALIAAFTFGSFGADGFSFVDDFLLAGKRQDAFAFTAGLVFNLGNMLFVAAIYVGGITPAAPVALGLALVLNGLMAPLLGQSSTPMLRYVGSAIVLGGVISGAIASRRWSMARLVEAMHTGKTKSTKKVISGKPVFLALLAGFFIGLSAPLMQMGRDAEIALGPYSFSFVFGLGIFFSTFLFNLFFMNLPVQGKAVDMADYFRAPSKSHFAGAAGGAIALLGLLTGLMSIRGEGAAHLEPKLSYALAEGSVLVTLLWGIIYWKELEGTDSKVNTPVVVTVLLLLGGLVVLTLAQVPPPVVH